MGESGFRFAKRNVRAGVRLKRWRAVTGSWETETMPGTLPEKGETGKLKLPPMFGAFCAQNQSKARVPRGERRRLSPGCQDDFRPLGKEAWNKGQTNYVLNGWNKIGNAAPSAPPGRIPRRMRGGDLLQVGRRHESPSRSARADRFFAKSAAVNFFEDQ